MAYQNRQTIKKPFKIKGFFIINGGVDGTVKKTHPSTFPPNKIKDLATLLIKGNRKSATRSVTTAKRVCILPVFRVSLHKGIKKPLNFLFKILH